MKFSVDVDSSTTATPATFSPFCRFCITPGCSGLLLAAIQFRPSHQTRCHSLQHFRRDAATRDAATQFSRPSRRHIVARRSLHDDSCEARNWWIIGFQRIHCSSRIHDFLAGGIVQKRATAPVFKKTLPHGSMYGALYLHVPIELYLNAGKYDIHWSFALLGIHMCFWLAKNTTRLVESWGSGHVPTFSFCGTNVGKA